MQPPQRPNLPDTMAGWATFEFTDECWERLAADKSVLALSRESLPVGCGAAGVLRQWEGLGR